MLPFTEISPSVDNLMKVLINFYNNIEIGDSKKLLVNEFAKEIVNSSPKANADLLLLGRHTMLKQKT